MRRAAGFVNRSGHELRWLFGDQPPEETAVAFPRRASLADRRSEIESNVTSRLDRGSDADRADAAAGYDENLIRFSVATIVQRADHRAKTDRHPVNAGDVQRADCVSQIEPILISEKSSARRTRCAPVS